MVYVLARKGLENAISSYSETNLLSCQMEHLLICMYTTCILRDFSLAYLLTCLADFPTMCHPRNRTIYLNLSLISWPTQVLCFYPAVASFFGCPR